MILGNSSCFVNYMWYSGYFFCKGQPFQLNWAWVSLEMEKYVADENTKFLEVTIRERGYLQETSFISR